MSTFAIRRAKSLEDLQWVIKMAGEEGFSPRENEAECYFSAGLTPYFYIGELNGKRIGCICRVSHGNDMAFGGYEIIAKPYRGQGYGVQLFQFAEALGDEPDTRMIVVMKLKDHIQRRGYRPGCMLKLYQFTASFAVEGLVNSQMPPSVARVLPASHADFEKLFAYSADMMGSSKVCKLLLAAWLCHLQKSSWVAIDDRDEIVGYLIMSDIMRFPESGYCIAPFFADSTPIARSLLKVAVEFASANKPRHNIVIDVPVDFNPECVRILESEIGAKPVEELTVMSSKELPTQHLSKVFSAASTQVL